MPLKNSKIIIINFLLILFGCRNYQAQNNDNSLNDPKQIYEKQSRDLLGKKIESINILLGDSTIRKDKVILVYNGFDCSNCITKAYSMAREIDSILNKKSVYIISVSANTSRDQSANQYFHYVFSDEHDELRKELKYINTPLYMILDSANFVIDTYIENPIEQESKRKRFIASCIKLFNTNTK